MLYLTADAANEVSSDGCNNIIDHKRETTVTAKMWIKSNPKLKLYDVKLNLKQKIKYNSKQ